MNERTNKAAHESRRSLLKEPVPKLDVMTTALHKKCSHSARVSGRLKIAQRFIAGIAVT